MAQSSNYKQYTRNTRVLTEETGFSGGMLWTGNNIDATHLKTIVNFDYDDTTGYLKSRDPFVPTNVTPTEEQWEALGETVDLTGKRLIGVYNICAQVVDTAEKLTDKYNAAGFLYLFGSPANVEGVWTTPLSTAEDSTSTPAIVAVYRDASDVYNTVDLDFSAGQDLKNIYLRNSLLLYDNTLYGLCNDDNRNGEWLQVFTLQYRETTVDNEISVTYTLHKEAYDADNAGIKSKFDRVGLAEAVQTGWNAARGSRMYTYTPTATDDEWRIDGAMLLDEYSDQVVASPKIGQDLTLRVTTRYISTMTQAEVGVVALFEQNYNESTDSSNLWAYRYHSTIDHTSTTGQYQFSIRPTRPNTTWLLVHYGSTHFAFGDIPDPYSSDAVDSYVVNITATQDLNNLKLHTYDFSECSGSCVWNNRLCLWGTTATNNALFISAIDNFYYFPVPNNVALFDTNVISCIPYKDTLLVFTADKIYQLSIGNDGTITQSVVQNDMPLSKTDAAQLTAIKNMVLFKSGNYFYMLVPKAQSLTGELSIAPIYKSIAGFLNNIDSSTLDVLQLLYPEDTFDSCEVLNDANPVDIYSEQDTVHILYDVSATVRVTAENTWSEPFTNSYKLFLNYNTNTRAWTIYIVETTNETLEAASLHASRLMTFVRIVQKADDVGPDAVAPGHFKLVMQQHSVNPYYSFRSLIDTGYRTLVNVTKKRFREIQVKLYSESESVTAFGTAFLVDGVFRRNYKRLTEVTSEHGTVCLAPSFDLNTFEIEVTMPVQDDGSVQYSPGSDRIELSDWSLDFSHFMRNAPSTVRIPVSGKGYAPRFILITPNTLNLYINEVNWVYRTMFGR